MTAGAEKAKTGPLAGLKVIEMAGLGPVPLAGLMLSEMGAEVLRIERAGSDQPLLPLSDAHNLDRHGRSILRLDLKQTQGTELVLRLVEKADLLVEGFRPGVMERLGLGPDILIGDNPRLVYGRMTGWGQDGPYAAAAGHDINYIALSGALGAFGRDGEKPTPPINLVGDFGGGGMMLAFGMVSALIGVSNGAPGQVVDCAMTDGSALLMAMMWGFRAAGAWRDERGTNLLDTGAPCYDTYETADGKFVAIGSLEPQFYALLREKVGIADDALFDAQMDRSRWPEQRARLTAIFKSRTRDDWCALLEATDACFAPVLGFDEAAAHPHNVARGTFTTVGGVRQPAPAPRYSATPCDAPTPPAMPGIDQALLDP